MVKIRTGVQYEFLNRLGIPWESPLFPDSCHLPVRTRQFLLKVARNHVLAVAHRLYSAEESMVATVISLGSRYVHRKVHILYQLNGPHLKLDMQEKG